MTVHELTLARHLNHKNHGVTHHGGHYCPYLPNYWELDIPPAAATCQGPERNIRNTTGGVAPSVFSRILARITRRQNKIFLCNCSIPTNAEAALGDIHPIASCVDFDNNIKQFRRWGVASGESFCFYFNIIST